MGHGPRFVTVWASPSHGQWERHRRVPGVGWWFRSQTNSYAFTLIKTGDLLTNGWVFVGTRQLRRWKGIIPCMACHKDIDFHEVNSFFCDSCQDLPREPRTRKSKRPPVKKSTNQLELF